MKNSRLDNFCYIALDPRKPGRWTYSWGGNERVFEYQPFYVGRGVDRRMESHMEDALRAKASIKNSIIDKIIRSGLQPIFYKIFENLNYDESFDIETDIINHFGRICDKSGILANLSDNKTDRRPLKKPYVKKEGPRLTKNSKRIDQFDLDGNFIKKWDGATIASKSLGFGVHGPTSITACCRNRKKEFRGFVWKYDGTCPLPPRVKTGYFERQVFQYSLEGVFINSFPSLREAGKQTGVSEKDLGSCARGTKKSAGGYQWLPNFQGDSCPPYSRSARKNPNSYLHKPVNCYDKDMNFIQQFESRKLGAAFAGVTSLTNALKHPQRTAGGYYWREVTINN